MAKRKPKTLMQRFEKLHMGLKFLILGGSAYLLVRKYEKEGEPIPIIGTVLPSAMMPLATPSVTDLPADGANPIYYQGASPDQMNTTRLLNTADVVPLGPPGT